MKKYKIEYDEQARQDMHDLFRFIADSFKAPLTAKGYTQGIYEVVTLLAKSAESIQISNQRSVLKFGTLPDGLTIRSTQSFTRFMVVSLSSGLFYPEL